MPISDEFYSSIWPTYYLSKLLGHAPFPLKSSSRPFVHFSICITYHLILVFLISNSIKDILSSFYTNQQLPKFERLVLGLQIISVVATVLISWYKSFFHHKTLIKILSDISFLGVEIELSGILIDYSSFLRFQKRIILSALAYAVLNFCQNNYMGENAPGIFVLVAGNAAMLLQFLLTLLLLNKYISLLNQRLMKYGKLRQDGYSNMLSKKNDSIVKREVRKNFYPIKQITELHRQLCSLCKQVNDYYSLSVLLSISHNMMNLTSICYFISAFIIDPPTSINFYLVVSLSTVLCIGIMSIIQLNSLAYVCSETRKKASFTGILVHGLLNSDDHAPLKEELQIFSKQILHQRITFTAAGFFVLDFTLINAVIGAVTTYLVILIQFQLST